MCISVSNLFVFLPQLFGYVGRNPPVLWRSWLEWPPPPLCGGALTLQVSPSDGEELWQTFISQIHFIDRAAVRKEHVALCTHADTGEAPSSPPAMRLEPLYGDCFISGPVHPQGGWGPRRMTLIFWKQSVQYWSVGMSSPWHGLIYWTWEGSLFPVIPEPVSLTFTRRSCDCAVCTHKYECVLLSRAAFSHTEERRRRKTHWRVDGQVSDKRKSIFIAMHSYLSGAFME